MMKITQKVYKQVVAEEVAAVLRLVFEIPADIPWSKAPHAKRVCPECGITFDPSYAYQITYPTDCTRRVYQRKYRNWKKQSRFNRPRRRRVA